MEPETVGVSLAPALKRTLKRSSNTADTVASVVVVADAVALRLVRVAVRCTSDTRANGLTVRVPARRLSTTLMSGASDALILVMAGRSTGAGSEANASATALKLAVSVRPSRAATLASSTSAAAGSTALALCVWSHR